MLEHLWTLTQLVVVDAIMAVDNAVLVVMIAMTVPAQERRQVLAQGIVLAVALRVVLGSMASYLMGFMGLTFAGGLVLLYVSYRMACEIVRRRHASKKLHYKYRSFRRAVLKIGLIDTIMSIDNVLAVSGISNGHIQTMFFGQLLSVGFMGVAANYFAHIIQRHRWVEWMGLAMVTYVALSMIWRGWQEVAVAMAAIAFPELGAG